LAASHSSPSLLPSQLLLLLPVASWIVTSHWRRLMIQFNALPIRSEVWLFHFSSPLSRLTPLLASWLQAPCRFGFEACWRDVQRLRRYEVQYVSRVGARMKENSPSVACKGELIFASLLLASKYVCARLPCGLATKRGRAMYCAYLCGQRLVHFAPFHRNQGTGVVLKEATTCCRISGGASAQLAPRAQ